MANSNLGDSSLQGYYRFPALGADRVIFVSEDDLWTVPLAGGVARRLTSGWGKITSTALSRDGQVLAFSSTREGHEEIYLMPANGGGVKRLTYLGATARVSGWTQDGRVLIVSNHQQAFYKLTDAYAVEIKHGRIEKLKCGPVSHVDIDQKGRIVIARHGGTELAYWKRYRGGTAGQIWVDLKGDGDFKPLFKKPMNSARPFWIGERIYFLSDHEGVANIYSATSDGENLKRHTHMTEFFARGLSSFGDKLVFHAGGDLFSLDCQTDVSEKLNIDYLSERSQASRRFVSARRYLEDFELSPNGERAIIAARGKTFSFELHSGPVAMHGKEGPLRSRLGRFMKDGKHIVLISDEGGEESLEIHDTAARDKVERLEGLDLGRTIELKLSPVADEAILSNHRHELIWIDLHSKKTKVIAKSDYDHIQGFNWSPDGKWVAFGFASNLRTCEIRVANLETGRVETITEPIRWDFTPFFDPSGDYLYFLSSREFDPVYDGLQFELGFPRGIKPCLVTLRKDVLSPLASDHPGFSAKEKSDSEKSDSKRVEIQIDFDGISERIVALPMPDGRYGQSAATREKFYTLRYPINGALNYDWRRTEPRADAQLEMYDLESEKTETILTGVTSFRLSQDGKHIIYRAGNSLRVIKAGEKPSANTDDHRRGAWLDLDRVQVPVDPRAEWRQMLREAWRLQRDHFWTEDMSKVNWQRVYDRYHPLLARVATRSEISDLINEMQGELGTSHAYEIGGDYRPEERYDLGFLGAESDFDASAGGYAIAKIFKGDLWDASASSPLARAGVGLGAGDVLVAIDGQTLNEDTRPESCLVHKAGQEIALTFRRQGRSQEEKETRSIRTLYSEQRLRYREWVNTNREEVHRATKGKIGYVHIPNMGPLGFSEFHRCFLTELDRDGLVIDVRFNGGGNVSQLILEKLARRRIGATKTRWSKGYPYPMEAPKGPMVALTNEYAGSDGDIFSHCFKLLKLGPLIGKRTWGGVIGISPSHSLVDGGFTTQPEYSTWFEDVGWGVENYGTDPDIEVEFPPADAIAGRDPQLEKAIEICMERLKKSPPKSPVFRDFPDLSLP